MSNSFVEYSRIEKSAVTLPPPPPKSGKYKIGVVTVDGTSHYYVLYNTKTKVCQIGIACSNEHIGDVVRVLNSSFPPDFWLWVTVPLTQGSFISCLQNFVDKGFGNPYVTDRTPFGQKLPHSVALVCRNTTGVRVEAQRTILNVMYILQQYKTSGCSLYARFNAPALRYLRQTSGRGHTQNGNGETSQKELGGTLHVVKTVKQGGQIVFIIGLDESTVRPGDEEEVHISPTRYNFHSHPKEAYVRHGVNKAWPSLTDYLGYLKLGNATIFHCVATIEGLYIMSFGKYWVDHLNKVSKSFIEDHYDIDHKRKMTPFQYIVYVNRIKYKGHPIFMTKFLPWNMARTIFSVSYKKKGMTCFPTEQQGILP
jgi:hypothetical protein